MNTTYTKLITLVVVLQDSYKYIKKAQTYCIPVTSFTVISTDYYNIPQYTILARLELIKHARVKYQTLFDIH
jgi:hypothetical protein